jgi:uncharacterized protein YfaS (alpha-2-macroglobulin family)
VSIPTEQLRELIRKGEIDYYEINGNQIHLYMLSMNPNEIKIFYISFRAEYPGSFRTLANNVFEYYQPEVSARQVSPILTILPN